MQMQNWSGQYTNEWKIIATSLRARFIARSLVASAGGEEVVDGVFKNMTSILNLQCLNL